MFVSSLPTEIFETVYCLIVHLSFLTSHSPLLFSLCKASWKTTTFLDLLSFFFLGKLPKFRSLKLNMSRMAEWFCDFWYHFVGFERPFRWSQLVSALPFSFNASINSKREHPPPGNFFLGSRKPCPGTKFFCKSTAPGTKTPTPREYFRRSSQPFLLIRVEILGFCRKQTLKRIGRLSNYSLEFGHTLCFTILKILKFSPSSETDFVQRVLANKKPLFQVQPIVFEQ